MLISIEIDVVDERHHWDTVNQKKKREEKFFSYRSFHGGQGSLNVNSWNPESTRFAFISYRHPER